jgi:hypothetical protein
MQRLQAFRFELMPNGQQERQMRRFAGACRFIYNKALALQKERYERGEKKLGYAGLCKLLTEWRNSAETAWLAEAPIHPLQQKLKDLERAYSNFFAGRADFPRFRKKGRSDSFRYPDPKQIKLDQSNSRIFLPKLGWLRYRNSRKVLGDLRNVTVSLSGGKWFVSIQTEREVEQAIPQGGAVGIDMGIARFATLSDGTFYAPLNSFKRHEERLRKAQQALSRKVKFSSNWKKAKARVQRIHARIANARRDFLHKTSTAISKKPRDSVYRGLAGAEYVPVGGRHSRCAGEKRSGQVQPEQVYPRSRLVRVPAATGVQALLEWRPSHHRTAAQHQPHLPVLRSCVSGQPPYTSPVRVRGMWVRGQRRCGRRDQHPLSRDENVARRRAGHDQRFGRDAGGLAACVSPDGLWIELHRRSEAGTRRDDGAWSDPCVVVVGISAL